jgi:dethiobiotin synthetase/malonyl-CoA O-methyltransferase
VQSGTDEGTDAATVMDLADAGATRIHPSRWQLRAPLSPDQAAAREGVRIGLEDFRLPKTDRPLVVEGAGGVLVPLNERDLMVDLMTRLGLPVLVVARSGLGTINHTLLTLEALRRRTVPVTGVVLVGPPQPDSRAAIERFGQVTVWAELPPLQPPSRSTLAALPPPCPCPQGCPGS